LLFLKTSHQLSCFILSSHSTFPVTMYALAMVRSITARSLLSGFCEALMAHRLPLYGNVPGQRSLSIATTTACSNRSHDLQWQQNLALHKIRIKYALVTHDFDYFTKPRHTDPAYGSLRPTNPPPTTLKANYYTVIASFSADFFAR
jgi:hypothetical protein